MKTKSTILVIAYIAGLFLVGCHSCKTYHKLRGTGPVELGAEDKFFLDKACQPLTKKAHLKDPSPCISGGLARSAQKYPVAGPEGRAIFLEKLSPTKITLNEPFDYKIKVTNLTNDELRNVVVTDLKPTHMKIKNSTYGLEDKGEYLQWTLESLGPKESKIISITAVAHEMGTIDTCAKATFDAPTCAKIEIVKPNLRITKSAPEDSLKCDRIPYSYIITNEGTGSACDVIIEDELPAGMMTSRGEKTVRFSFDTLVPGASREFNVMVDATAPGQYASAAVARAKNGDKAHSNMPETMVTQPVLALEESCPASQYIGRSVTYDITVSNVGNGVAQDAVIVASVPESAEFKDATSGGFYTHSSPGIVTWKVKEMQPDSSETFSMKLKVIEAGTLLSTSTAEAYCADPVAESCQTDLAGVPGILLEVIDVADPIELGEIETYIVTATNQGTKAGTNILISCLLEDSMEFVSTSGKTKSTLVGKKIIFEPLPILEVNSKASWRISIKAIGEGDVRFTTMMNSDQLGRDVYETEATTFYK